MKKEVKETKNLWACIYYFFAWFMRKFFPKRSIMKHALRSNPYGRWFLRPYNKGDEKYNELIARLLAELSPEEIARRWWPLEILGNELSHDKFAAILELPEADHVWFINALTERATGPYWVKGKKFYFGAILRWLGHNSGENVDLKTFIDEAIRLVKENKNLAQLKAYQTHIDGIVLFYEEGFEIQNLLLTECLEKLKSLISWGELRNCLVEYCCLCEHIEIILREFNLTNDQREILEAKLQIAEFVRWEEKGEFIINDDDLKRRYLYIKGKFGCLSHNEIETAMKEVQDKPEEEPSITDEDSLRDYFRNIVNESDADLIQSLLYCVPADVVKAYLCNNFWEHLAKFIEARMEGIKGAKSFKNLREFLRFHSRFVWDDNGDNKKDTPSYAYLCFLSLCSEDSLNDFINKALPMFLAEKEDNLSFDHSFEYFLSKEFPTLLANELQNTATKYIGKMWKVCINIMTLDERKSFLLGLDTLNQVKTLVNYYK